MTSDDTMNEPNDSTRRSALSSDAWQQRYVVGETGWDRGEPSPALMRWLSTELLTPSRVLVPGCGRGHEVVELASRGFDVTAVDFAITPVQELTRRLTKANLVADVVREDIFRFVASDPFDAVYEQTSLCAIEPKNWGTYEERLFEHLKPGGLLLASFMQTKKPGGPPYHCDTKAIKDLFHVNRWLWPEESFTVSHPSGLFEIAMVLTKRRIA